MTTPRIYGWTLHPLVRFALKEVERGRPKLRNLIEPSKNDAAYYFNVNSRAPFKPFQIKMHQSQLGRLPHNIDRRRDIVRQIKERLRHVRGIRLLREDKHGRANCSYFGIDVPDPGALAKHLEHDGVASNPREYFDCSRLDQFAAYHTNCPNSRRASTHILRLPSYPALKDSEVNRITSSIERYFARSRSRRGRESRVLLQAIEDKQHA
jgi:hypothetical protein